MQRSGLSIFIKRLAAVSVIVMCLTVSLVSLSRPAWALFGLGDIVLDPANLVENTTSAGMSIKSLAYDVQKVQNTLNTVQGLTNLRGNFMDVGSLFGLGAEFRQAQRLYDDVWALEYSFAFMQDMAARGDIAGVLHEVSYLQEDLTKLESRSDTFSKSVAESAKTFGQVKDTGQASIYASERAGYLETSSHTLYGLSVETLEATAKAEETAKKMQEDSKAIADTCGDSSEEAPAGGTGGSGGCIRDLLASIDSHIIALYSQGEQERELLAHIGHSLAAQGFYYQNLALKDMELNDGVARAIKSRPGASESGTP